MGYWIQVWIETEEQPTDDAVKESIKNFGDIKRIKVLPVKSSKFKDRETI